MEIMAARNYSRDSGLKYRLLLWMMRGIEKLGNEYGQEFWYARELQYALEYASWAKFKRVLNKAITACNNSEASIDDHFAQVGKMVEAGIAPKALEVECRGDFYYAYRSLEEAKKGALAGCAWNGLNRDTIIKQ